MTRKVKVEYTNIGHKWSMTMCEKCYSDLLHRIDGSPTAKAIIQSVLENMGPCLTKWEGCPDNK